MKNNQFERDIEVVPKNFNKLAIVNIDGENILQGDLDIIDSVGKFWGTYRVEIRGSRDYPQQFPKLFETNNAFPKIMDWHVYEEDGSCCVDVTPNELIICSNGLHVLDYLRSYAIPYFANQKFRELEGYYLYGEYAHGIFGRIEFYQKKLMAKNPQNLLEMLQLIIQGFSPGRTEYCPFCHKVKFRRCHRDAFRELGLIKPFIHYDLQNLTSFFIYHPGFILPGI